MKTLAPLSKLPPHVRRRLLVGGIAAAAAGIVGLFCLGVALMGLPALGVAWQGWNVPRLVVALYGSVMCGVGYLGIVRSPAWFRRGAWLKENGGSQESKLVLKRRRGVTATEWWVELSGLPNMTGQFAVLPPTWDAEASLDKSLSGKVYVDPYTRLPMVFETAAGELWARPTVQRSGG